LGSFVEMTLTIFERKCQMSWQEYIDVEFSQFFDAVDVILKDAIVDVLQENFTAPEDTIPIE
jgi:hypothetical protein